MRKRFICLSLILVFLTSIAIPRSLAKPESCNSYWDGCAISATYYDDGDYTTWAMYCDDGFYADGVIGGDEVPAICF